MGSRAACTCASISSRPSSICPPQPSRVPVTCHPRLLCPVSGLLSVPAVPALPGGTNKETSAGSRAGGCCSCRTLTPEHSWGRTPPRPWVRRPTWSASWTWPASPGPAWPCSTGPWSTRSRSARPAYGSAPAWRGSPSSPWPGWPGRRPSRPSRPAGTSGSPTRPGRTTRRFAALLQYYLATRQFSDELLELGRGDRVTDAKAGLAAELPARRAEPDQLPADQPGGAQAGVRDRRRRACWPAPATSSTTWRTTTGRPRQVDRSAVQLGRNLAATPGKVVFRNDLMELIQYAPQTATGARRSRCWPARRGSTSTTSWTWPPAAASSSGRCSTATRCSPSATATRTPAMRGVTLDDYLIDGPQTALDVITDITGAPKINIVGLCLGGALTAHAGRLPGRHRRRPDQLAHPAQHHARLQRAGRARRVHRRGRPWPGWSGRWREHGFLEGAQMAGTFDLLRANDLIFSYVVSNWLMGQQPPAFDILAWNATAPGCPPPCTRSTCARCTSQRTGPGRAGAGRAAAVAGRRQATTSTWSARSTTTSCRGRRPTRRPGCSAATSGTCCPAAATSPASSTRPARRPGTEAAQTATRPPRLSGGGAAERHDGSWWEDWAQWAGARAGRACPAARMGSAAVSRPLGDAPGSYVQG